MKPYSSACDRNREPILEVLRECFAAAGKVLEIGSGTGQHAVYFARALPQLEWYASDQEEHHAGIRLWFDEAQLANLHGPLSLDVKSPSWPTERFDAVFSANTAHIMSWPEVEHMFAGVGQVLREGGCFCLYGPFNRSGEFTSASNQAFDAALRARDRNMGIRNDQDLFTLARMHQLEQIGGYIMPANNRILAWRKSERIPSAN